MKAVLVALTLSVALGLPGASAQAEPKPTSEAAAYRMPPTQAADEKVVEAALQASSFEALATHQEPLKVVLAHAPPRFPRVEERAGVTIVRDDEIGAAGNLRLLLAAAAGSRSTTLIEETNTYGHAALLLAMYSNEMKRPQEAIAFADRGLAYQPDNARLVTEKAAALELLHKPADALATLDAWRSRDPIASEIAQARVLRARGYALIELKRLDEAEAAYKESLNLEPDHKGAEKELAFIAGARQGRPPYSAQSLTTYGKAKAGTDESTPKN